MGINQSAFKLLLKEKQQRNFQGNILQLGRQFVFFTHQEALKLARQHQVTLEQVDAINLSFDQKLATLGFIDDITLFKLLGFHKVHSADYSDYESSTYKLDFNQPIPTSLHHQYDYIFDGGTLEHIFNFFQSLKNIHHLLKANGTIIHSSPSNNHVDHGYYMFSPSVFYDYYAVNKYQVLTSNILEYSPNYYQPWKVYHYKTGCLDSINYGGFGKKMLGIWFIAKKHPDSTDTYTPQQKVFTRMAAQKPTQLSQFYRFRAKIQSTPVLSTCYSIFKWLKNKYLYKKSLKSIN